MERIVIAILTCTLLAACGYGQNNGPNNMPGKNSNGVNGGPFNGNPNGSGQNNGDQDNGGQNQQGTADGTSMNDTRGAGGAAGIVADPIIVIRPPDGGTVSSKQPVELQYRAEGDVLGNQISIRIDNGRSVIVYRMSGIYQIQPLDPGNHTIVLAATNDNHAALGQRAVIHLNVE